MEPRQCRNLAAWLAVAWGKKLRLLHSVTDLGWGTKYGDSLRLNSYWPILHRGAKESIWHRDLNRRVCHEHLFKQATGNPNGYNSMPRWAWLCEFAEVPQLDDPAAVCGCTVCRVGNAIVASPALQAAVAVCSAIPKATS